MTADIDSGDALGDRLLLRVAVPPTSGSMHLLAELSSASLDVQKAMLVLDSGSGALRLVDSIGGQCVEVSLHALTCLLRLVMDRQNATGFEGQPARASFDGSVAAGTLH